MNGQEQHMPEMKEHEGMRRFKTLFKVSMAIIVVLLIVLVVNGIRMRNLEGGYATGYNECANKCNEKLDLLKSNCVPINIPADIQGPVEDNNASIQIVTG